MIKEITISVSPDYINDLQKIKSLACKELNVSIKNVSHFQVIKKSLDARNKRVRFNFRLKLVLNKPDYESDRRVFDFKDVTNKLPHIIIGAGPAGLFAALQLLELGEKPVILERGVDVNTRKKDVAQIMRNNQFNEESNYCFGEGGAGTFSDGKLYTRSSKRGDVSKVLELLHMHGADENILYEAHAHIGSDKLPNVIKNIRKTILNCGGEIHFGKKVVDFIIKNSKVSGVKTSDNDTYKGLSVILATGHSAHDVYELLLEKKIPIEAKPFAMGVRVEHPQELIDNIQYHGFYHNNLPAASYSLVNQIENRGVYSFCMCPGGYVVPAATQNGETVVNGMSPSARNSPFANSGIVVEMRMEDLPNNESPLAGLKFQNEIERMAYVNSGRFQAAPAQRLNDFVKGKISTDLPGYSYIPGAVISPVHFWLPELISKKLQKAFIQFDKKMHGFLTNEAIVYGVESRTSSPVRIIRDRETYRSPGLDNFYPCGEGAGFAGGIVSSAIDGMNVAEKAITLST